MLVGLIENCHEDIIKHLLIAHQLSISHLKPLTLPSCPLSSLIIVLIIFPEALQLVSAAAAHANDAMKRTEKFKKVLEVQVEQCFFCFLSFTAISFYHLSS